MKTSILFTFIASLLILSSVTLSAQNKPSTYYIEVTENAIMGMRSISVDFGLDAPAGKSYRITDESETKILEFKNTIAALNYLSSQGWEIINAYDRITGKAGSRTVYLLKFDASKYPKTALVKAIDKVLADYKQ